VKRCLTRRSRQNLSNPKRLQVIFNVDVPVIKYPIASNGIVDATSIKNHVERYLYRDIKIVFREKLTHLLKSFLFT